MAQGSVYIFAIILVAIRLKLDFSWAKYYVISSYRYSSELQ
ncbi:hypothetical protein [Psychrosphaera algicola]|uniref:Uncharacterized protein n=1 Tax=Psychrosphaera algicola TaxID=3023714 RepID=A0ABT5F9V5_9GAMM|nr:hypothetical protein [Psychrosphaera sp. G1-22]MDC2887844.1 hypothetical protein [Psychrosphaera sp. G1-22]